MDGLGQKLEDGKIAVLLMNNAAVKADVALNFESDLGITTCGKDGKDSCSIRDINLHKNLGNFEDGYIAKQLLPHDSAFLIISVAKKLMFQYIHLHPSQLPQQIS